MIRSVRIEVRLANDGLNGNKEIREAVADLTLAFSRIHSDKLPLEKLTIKDPRGPELSFTLCFVRVVF